MKTNQRVNSKFLLISALPISIVIFFGVVSLWKIPSAWGADPICGSGNVITCEDWETGRDGWDWNNNWSTASGVKCGNVGFQSDCALKLHFNQDASDAIFPMRSIPEQIGEVYARFYIKYSVGYKWNAPGSKVFYIRSSSNGSYSWSIQLGSLPEDSTDLFGPGKFYMDLQNHRIRLPYNRGTAADGSIVQGQWYSVEMLGKANTLGQSNGYIKLWINGILVMDYTGLDVRSYAADPTSEINRIWISAYIGGPTHPHPAQDIWYDNIVASTNYIGPIGGPINQVDTTPPMPPTSLRVVEE